MEFVKNAIRKNEIQALPSFVSANLIAKARAAVAQDRSSSSKDSPPQLRAPEQMERKGIHSATFLQADGKVQPHVPSSIAVDEPPPPSALDIGTSLDSVTPETGPRLQSTANSREFDIHSCSSYSEMKGRFSDDGSLLHSPNFPTIRDSKERFVNVDTKESLTSGNQDFSRPLESL